MTPGQARIKHWRENPVAFVFDNFQATPDRWQIKALEAFGDQDQKKLRMALRACVGPGKSTILAWCGWNFLSCYGETGHHPKGAVVSITATNLKDNLWAEFSKWRSRSPYLMEAFTWTQERIYANHHPETWFLSARSFNKDSDAEAQGRTLSGLHSKYVLAMLDESGEIPLPVLKAAEQALAERDCYIGRILQAGNPSSLDGILYAAATQLAHLWLNIRVTGDPDDPDRSPRIDIEWAREQIKTYGRHDPWVKYSILGEFPEASINKLIGVEEVEAAMNRHLTEDKYNFSQKRLGMDVAFERDDSSIIFPRQGLAAFRYKEMRGMRSQAQAACLLQAKKDFESEMEFVDDTGGWSKGVQDFFSQAGVAITPVNFAGKAMDPRYYNSRAEMYWRMTQWVKNGGALPNCPKLRKELLAPTYTLQNGRFLIEDKRQIKKRLGFSPDRADALATTFYLPDMPRSLVIPGTNQPVGLSNDYDPFKTV